MGFVHQFFWWDFWMIMFFFKFLDGKNGRILPRLEAYRYRCVFFSMFFPPWFYLETLGLYHKQLGFGEERVEFWWDVGIFSTPKCDFTINKGDFTKKKDGELSKQTLRFLEQFWFEDIENPAHARVLARTNKDSPNGMGQSKYIWISIVWAYMQRSGILNFLNQPNREVYHTIESIESWKESTKSSMPTRFHAFDSLSIAQWQVGIESLNLIIYLGKL